MIKLMQSDVSVYVGLSADGMIIEYYAAASTREST